MRSVATILLVGALLLPLSAPAAERVTHDGAAISGSDAGGGGPFEPTFPAIQANVFTPSCALSFCHGASMSAGLYLRPGMAYASIVDVPSVEVPSWDRIEPFDPETSYLICKLEACPSMIGQQMPLIGGPLSPDVIGVIRQWVLDGAPETPISVDPDTWGRIKAGYR